MNGTFEGFGLTFHWYGLILGIAVVLVSAVAEWAADHLYGGKPIDSVDVRKAFWSVVMGEVVGARLYHVVDLWAYYRVNPAQIWRVWEGGLGIYGAIGGGVVGAFLYVLCTTTSTQRADEKQKGLVQFGSGDSFFIDFKRWLCAGLMSLTGRLGWKPGPRNQLKKTTLYQVTNNISTIWLRFLALLDVVGVGMLLGQAVGRVGNFINRELYGLPSDVAWAVYIPVEKRQPGYELVTHYHPLFWYEALWNIVGFWWLWRIVCEKRLVTGRGNYFLWYLGWYSLGRVWLEWLRINPWKVGVLPMASVIAAGILVGVGILYNLRKRRHEWEVLVD